MAIKKKTIEEKDQEEAAPEGNDRTCDCGDNADVWDGRCRRCQLLQSG